MDKYFPRVTVIGIISALVLFTVLSPLLIGDTWEGWKIIYALPIVAVTVFLIKGYINRKLKKICAIFVEQCNALEFIGESNDLATRIRRIDNTFDAAFISYRAHALLDLHNEEDSRCLTQMLLDDNSIVDQPRIVFHASHYAFSLMFELFGIKGAKTVIRKQQKLISKINDEDEAMMSLMEMNQNIVHAYEDKDYEFIALHYHALMHDNVTPMFYRVRGAALAANAYNKLGDYKNEVLCLEFIVSNGNTLTLVSESRKKLEELL